jgi:hypothetical protein
MVGAARQRAEADRSSVAVLEVVAAAEGCDPRELNPLYERIDPEAIDTLVNSPMQGQITFTYHGYELQVHGDGEVAVLGRT